MIIETSNLLIRNLNEDEIEEARNLHNHPSVLNFLTDTHFVSSDEQIDWFTSLQKSKTSKRLVCRKKISNKLVGIFRLDKIDRVNMTVEVGLDVILEERRKGYALEIYKAMLYFLFTKENFYRVSLWTLENNSPAINLYQKLGFRQEGIAREAIVRDNMRLNLLLYGLNKHEDRVEIE
jgi:RimJ/RimL family protein N-acetyltransferase